MSSLYDAIIREVKINDSIIRYDAMSRSPLEEASSFYSNYNYIGSSNEYYINGKKQTIGGQPPENAHFFTLKPKP